MERNRFIDIEKVIRDKNPRLAAVLPRLVLNYIRRIVHEKEVNAFIAENGGKKGFAFAGAILDHFHISLRAEGLHHIPAQGRFILAANHPLGGLDAMALFRLLEDRRRDIRFIVNDILMRLENLNDLFFGVEKHGVNTRRNLEEMIRLFASGQGVLIFPAGLVSRRRKGLVRDLPWKKTFITHARQYRRDVIPVHLTGRLTNRFYRLASLRAALGIRANIEMFFLVDEMFRQRNQVIGVTVQAPIPYSMFDHSRSDAEWAAWVREKVYAGR